MCDTTEFRVYVLSILIPIPMALVWHMHVDDLAIVIAHRSTIAGSSKKNSKKRKYLKILKTIN